MRAQHYPTLEAIESKLQYILISNMIRFDNFNCDSFQAASVLKDEFTGLKLIMKTIGCKILNISLLLC